MEERSGKRYQNVGEVRLGVIIIYFIVSPFSDPTLVMLGAPGDKAYVIFTVALVKLRIPHFHLLPFLCQTNFTWFSLEYQKKYKVDNHTTFPD
jgi:hypothetical protein